MQIQYLLLILGLSWLLVACAGDPKKILSGGADIARFPASSGPYTIVCSKNDAVGPSFVTAQITPDSTGTKATADVTVRHGARVVLHRPYLVTLNLWNKGNEVYDGNLDADSGTLKLGVSAAGDLGALFVKDSNKVAVFTGGDGDCALTLPAANDEALFLSKYGDNDGCFAGKSFKMAGYGSGFWMTDAQGTNSGGSGSRSVRIIPLNEAVALALLVAKDYPDKYLCLGGAAIGGPYDGHTPESIYAMTAHWR